MEYRPVTPEETIEAGDEIWWWDCRTGQSAWVEVPTPIVGLPSGQWRIRRSTEPRAQHTHIQVIDHLIVVDGHVAEHDLQTTIETLRLERRLQAFNQTGPMRPGNLTRDESGDE